MTAPSDPAGAHLGTEGLTPPAEPPATEPPPDPPSWFTPRGTGNELSAQSVALIDGAETHFAACLRAAAPACRIKLGVP